MQLALNNKIYFDHNASCPVLPEVNSAINDILTLPINASSTHSFGKLGKKILENSRSNLLKAVSALSNKYKAIFTASGTEANNLAILGLKHSYKPITSSIEHPSVLRILGQGVIPVDCNGVVNLEALERILSISENPTLVSIIYASNETGVIQPIKEVVNIAHKYGAIVHSDASQALGKLLINVDDLDIDLLTICGHKFGAPLGAGALIFKKDLPIQNILYGGGQEYRFRPGTHNIIAIHGLGVACSLIDKINEEFSKTKELRDYLEEEILIESPKSTIFSKNSARLPNVSSFTMPGVDSETQVIYFDLNGVAVSAGSACSSGKVDLPYVQMAMGYDHKVATSSIRISLGPSNSMKQILYFIDLWKALKQQTQISKTL